MIIFHSFNQLKNTPSKALVAQWIHPLKLSNGSFIESSKVKMNPTLKGVRGGGGGQKERGGERVILANAIMACTKTCIFYTVF